MSQVIPSENHEITCYWNQNILIPSWSCCMVWFLVQGEPTWQDYFLMHMKKKTWNEKLNERRKKKAFKTFMKMAILCLQELQEEEQIWKKVVKKLNFTEIDNFILLEQLVTDNFPKYNCSRKLVSFSVLRNSYKVLAEQFKVLVALQL